MTSDSPFDPAFSRQCFFETLGVGELLRRLDDGLGAREPFLLVTGEPGTGKTALVNEALARWGSRVTSAFLAYPALTGTELLEEIIRRFGGEPPDGAGRSKLLACFERTLTEKTGGGQLAMLVVDDAHDLLPERLEELRLLVNAVHQVRRPLEVMLIGPPILESRLGEPALEALRQRVSVRAKLEPLSAAETQRYLHHRIAAVGGDGPSLFSRKTCRDIAGRTGGVPRQINSLAAEALRVARVRGDQTVGVEHVTTAAAALWGLVPAAAVEDSGDDGSEDSPAPIATPRPSVAARAPAVVPAPAAVVAPAPAAVVVPAPAAVVVPAPAAVVAPRIEASASPILTAPANHDPREWVARFVGDSGPVQLSSRSIPESTWAAEPSEANSAESPSPIEPPPMRRDRPERARSRSRSRHRGGSRVAMTTLLAVVVVAGAVAVVMRAGGLARGRARQTAKVATTATAPPDSSRVSAPAVLRTFSGTPGASRRPRISDRRPDGPTTKSRQPFTLEVGGDLDLQSALEQRERMQELTGFEGWVVPVSDGGGNSYRIVLGAYRSHERARAAADMLLRSKTLRNVNVVALPPRSARR